VSRAESLAPAASEFVEAFSAVVDVLPVVAYLADIEGNVTFVSSGWQRFTGNAPAALLGRSYLTLVHPEDLPRVQAAVQAGRDAGVSYTAELRIRFGDGSYRWVSTQADPIRDRGQLVFWCGLVREVHDWRLAEIAMAEALRAADERADSLASSEARYRLLSESLPGTTWTATPDGLLDYVTEGDLTMHPGAESTLLGDAWLQALHPADREAALARWRESVTTGEPYEAQFRVRIRAGGHRWHLVRAVAQRDDDGAIVRWVGVNVDIDDQRRADEAREKFVALVENSGDIIAMTDPEGNVTYANPAARELLSLERTEPLHIIEYFRPEDRAFVESEIAATVMREGRWVGEFQMQNQRTGASLPILHSAFALTDARGEMMGMATISRDLRERHRIDIGMRALAEAGAVMYASLDYEETLHNIAEAVARTFATFCSIDVIDDAGTVRRIAVAHPRPEQRSFLRRYTDQGRFTAQHPVLLAIRSGISTCVPDATRWETDPPQSPSQIAALERLRVRCFMTVPVRAPGGSIFGAMSCSLDYDDPHPAYTNDDLPFAEELGRRAGIAVEHARAYEREHAIAMRFQEASLPGELPNVAGVALSADYRPGNSEATIGGDWYDAFLLDDGRVVLTIGDVLGKGLDAAVTMAKVRQAMRSAAALLPEPSAMLTAAESAVREVAAHTYATALAAIYDPRTCEVVFATAGHPGPMLLHADGRIDDCTANGILLGLRPPGPGETVTLTAPRGSTLVFFTDGLTEATHDIEEGYRRLHEALSDRSVATARNRARALVDHVLSGSAATDDVAVLVAEIGPAAVRGVWRVPSNPEEVPVLRRAVRALVAETIEDEADRSLLELAAGEVVSNAVEYGSGAFVEVSLEILSDRAVLAVSNQGLHFERRHVALKSMGMSESGRGLALLAELGFALTIGGGNGRCIVTASLRRHASRGA
jgi:PAS domain S-box-containing protein